MCSCSRLKPTDGRPPGPVSELEGGQVVITRLCCLSGGLLLTLRVILLVIKWLEVRIRVRHALNLLQELLPRCTWVLLENREKVHKRCDAVSWRAEIRIADLLRTMMHERLQ